MMRFSSLSAWCVGIWLAAGVQLAAGGGMPGPVFLVAIAAGVWAGLPTGLVVGTLAGLCEALLGQQDFISLAMLTMLSGAAAGLLTRWFARTHLLVGMLAALLTSCIVTLTLGVVHGRPTLAALLFALRRGGENTLWMIPIYGIVLVVSLQRTSSDRRGEI